MAEFVGRISGRSPRSIECGTSYFDVLGQSTPTLPGSFFLVLSQYGTHCSKQNPERCDFAATHMDIRDLSHSKLLVRLVGNRVIVKIWQNRVHSRATDAASHLEGAADLHWIGWLFDYLMVIGFANHLSEPLMRAWHEGTWGSLLIAAGMVALIIGHFGRSETFRLGRLVTQLGGWIRSAGECVQRLPDRINSILNPPTEKSTLSRRHREVKSDRRAGAFLAIGVGSFVAFYLGIFIYGRIFPPVPSQIEISRLTPPPAPQPFDKRWEAPQEKTGVGGGLPDDRVAVPAQDEIVLSGTVPIPKTRPKQSNSAPAHHNMKDPWNFPRF
jgi:hypothetical protein